MSSNPRRRFSNWPGRLGGGDRPHAPLHKGHHYDPDFLSEGDEAAVRRWLGTLHPLWENRFSDFRPPPEGQTQRRLLRPVYWLGNWQFACLDYYRPPHGVENRCVRAEPFPPVLARLVKRIEATTRTLFKFPDLPHGWKLNTCLVNFYGARREGEKWVDTARVGEHKDFEPGPVASLSLGERALLQFVESRHPGQRDGVVLQQWLEHGSLQIFGGPKWKSRTFHRVQRVETRGGFRFHLQVEDFETRRVNFTFRYVPEEHVVPWSRLSAEARQDVAGYMSQLATHSAYFARELGQPPT